MKWALVAILLGCTTRPAELPDQLQTATEQIVRSWRLDRAAWERIVVEPYRRIYDDYVRAFDAAVPALVATLSRRGVITTPSELAPACAAYLDTMTPPACRDVGWMIADAAVRADRAPLERACRLAASVCPVLDQSR